MKWQREAGSANKDAAGNFGLSIKKREATPGLEVHSVFDDTLVVSLLIQKFLYQKYDVHRRTKSDCAPIFLETEI